MQSPDWPPAGALQPSPFPHPVLHVLHGLGRVLLFPVYWALDQLLGCWAPPARSSGLGWLSAGAGAAAVLLLLLLCLPLALLGLLLWLPLQAWRRPFCYQPPPWCWVPPAPWCPWAEPTRCFQFLSANLCLLPDGLARFSNLPHSQQRAQALSAVLLTGLRPSRYGAMDCSPQQAGASLGVLEASVPVGLDFVCLQEVFDLRAAHHLVRCLAPSMALCCTTWVCSACSPGRTSSCWAAVCCWPRVSRCCAQTSTPSPTGAGRTHWPPKGCYRHRCSWAFWTGRRVAGFLHCTHLQAPSEDGPVRYEQLTLLLDWAERFETESCQDGEVVAFSVLLGDLNFDNCSLGDALEQKHPLFSRFQDPCRLGMRQEQPWALGTLLSSPLLHHSQASSPEMLRRALEGEEGRRLYLAGAPTGSHSAEAWRGRRLDYILYRGGPGSPLSPEVERVTFSTALAGLTDHLAVGLRLRVLAPL